MLSSSRKPPHERASRTFARLLADRLQKARLASQFERLVLVAEPHFLGHLREALDPHTERLVVASVNKDLAKVADAEIAPHLGELPRAAPL